ncbi:MAG: hypothetical protein MUD01_25325 [Chloroflexaceae bacterium]|jgi:hypothetical protein|nr:hypothetical protein [Chloroflexaceae bacterium]
MPDHDDQLEALKARLALAASDAERAELARVIATYQAQPVPDDAQRTVTTDGGDYAEGDVDKRSGTFIAGNQYNIFVQPPHPATLTPPVGQSRPALDIPFVAGPPITEPQAFFGREALVSRIFGKLKRHPFQNSVIIGPQRSGKTSLLHYLRAITRTPRHALRPGQRNDWLSEPEQYRWVLVDFQDKRLGSREGLLRHLLGSLQLTAPEPCTLERALDVLCTGLRHPTVVLLDEIGTALQRYPELDDDLWESLRALGPQVGGRLGFVLAAHRSPVELVHDSGHSSPFFNIFGYTAHLEPLREEEARALIACSPIPFSEEDIVWLLTHSRRWPILLQTLCRERLAALEAGEQGSDWRAEALRQIEQYRL